MLKIFTKGTNNTNLVSKLEKYLGSRKRSEMRIPDKAIYGSSRAHLRHFVDTLVSLAAKPLTERPGQFLFVSANRKLMNNMEIICLLAGYGFSKRDYEDETKSRINTNNKSSWHVRKVEKKPYSGSVYEIDLFDGLVYVTEGSLPVWMSPK